MESAATLVYQTTPDGIAPEQLHGFFVGWPQPPTPQTHLALLQASAFVVVAREVASGRVVGFVTALSDGILFAYISLLEVLPEHQGQGVGTALMETLLAQLSHLYAIDLLCDPDLQAFYRRCGLQPATGMLARNYARQSGQG